MADLPDPLPTLPSGAVAPKAGRRPPDGDRIGALAARFDQAAEDRISRGTATGVIEHGSAAASPEGQTAGRAGTGGGEPDGAPTPGAGTAAGRAILASAGRIVGSLAVALLAWQAAVTVFAPPRFILPAPLDVAGAFLRHGGRLFAEGSVTLLETVAGLAAGIVFGVITGLATAASPLVGRLVTPLLVVSQALPVFALAPLLVLWFGFGLASKIVMTTLVIYFPVASSLADGLGRTDPGLIDLARLSGASRTRTLALIRFPAALPALVSGIRVAAVFAPIGAVIGEWVGASQGLGLLMVQANARMQTDLLFAALVLLATASLVLKAVVDRATRRLIPWAEAPDVHEGST